MDWLIALSIMVFALLAAVLLFRAVKYRGWEGALFKTRISRTVGSMTVVNTSSRELHIKVHALQKSEPGWVGVEFERFNGESWQVSPLVLSQAEAGQLADLLNQAAT